ncbi:hypothetical protein ACEQ8H_004632 [Pleosporales sp. CAS-2024a]
MSATAIASSDVGLPPSSYIYKIISTAPRQDALGLTCSKLDQLAAISSDDSLRFVSPAGLAVNGVIQNVNEKVTCLERANDAESNVVVTAGRDGFIRFWDKRTQQKALEIESPHKLISALVCDAPNNFIGAGIENPEDGAGVSPVYVCTDGLVNVFDTSQADEEEALYQVINHGSAVAHAGFMYPSTDMYVLGTDETLSFHALQSQTEDNDEPAPKAFGDVREALGCEYLVDMHWIGAQPFIAAGQHSHSRLSLVPMTTNTSASASAAPLSYAFHPAKAIHLPGAHAQEIVRHLFTDIHIALQDDDDVHAEQDAAQQHKEGKRRSTTTTTTSEKKKEQGKEERKKKEKRFKPY